MLKRIVVVGSRHRGWKDGVPVSQQTGSPEDREVFQAALLSFRARFPLGFCIMTQGGNMGFGRMVKDTCEAWNIPCVEVLLQFNSYLPKSYYELHYLSRHAALLDLGQEFHIFVSKARVSNIEDLIGRLRQIQRLPYYVYDETNQIVEQWNGNASHTI